LKTEQYVDNGFSEYRYLSVVSIYLQSKNVPRRSDS